jgi:predicted nucleotidyltransferase
MVDESVADIIQHYLAAIEDAGIPVSFGVLFGSFVRNQAKNESDIDLVVVSPHYDRSIQWNDVSLLWRIAGRIDSRIEPVPCGEKEWGVGGSRAVLDFARRDGVKILLVREHSPAV